MASLQLSNLRLEKILLEEKHFAIGTIHVTMKIMIGNSIFKKIVMNL